MNEVPLIYTSRGNLPIDSLDYSTEWTFEDKAIVFTEMHKDKTDGTVVRKAVHIQLLAPDAVRAETERLN